MDKIPNYINCFLKLNIYKQDKVIDKNISGKDIDNGIGQEENKIMKGGGSLKLFKQEDIFYRSSIQLPNSNNANINFDSLVKITDAAMKSSKNIQRQLLVPAEFQSLIKKMNEQSGKSGKIIFYSDTGEIAILEKKTMTIPAPLPTNIKEISNLKNGPTIYTSNNGVEFISKDGSKFNIINKSFTINGITYSTKSEIEQLIEATTNGTVSNNMEVTINNLFALNSKLYLDSSSNEATIFKQSHSDWVYNLSSNYESLYKERNLYKDKPFEKEKLNGVINKSLTAFYDDPTHLNENKDFNDKIVDKNYTVVSPQIKRVIDSAFTEFLSKYSSGYNKEYLKKEYENIKQLDDANIPIEVRFKKEPNFYINSYKLNNDVYTQLYLPIKKKIKEEEEEAEATPIDERIATASKELDKLKQEVTVEETEIAEFISKHPYPGRGQYNIPNQEKFKTIVDQLVKLKTELFIQQKEVYELEIKQLSKDAGMKGGSGVDKSNTVSSPPKKLGKKPPSRKKDTTISASKPNSVSDRIIELAKYGDKYSVSTQWIKQKKKESSAASVAATTASVATTGLNSSSSVAVAAAAAAPVAAASSSVALPLKSTTVAAAPSPRSVSRIATASQIPVKKYLKYSIKPKYTNKITHVTTTLDQLIAIKTAQKTELIELTEYIDKIFKLWQELMPVFIQMQKYNIYTESKLFAQKSDYSKLYEYEEHKFDKILIQYDLEEEQNKLTIINSENIKDQQQKIEKIIKLFTTPYPIENLMYIFYNDILQKINEIIANPQTIRKIRREIENKIEQFKKELESKEPDAADAPPDQSNTGVTTRGMNSAQQLAQQIKIEEIKLERAKLENDIVTKQLILKEEKKKSDDDQDGGQKIQKGGAIEENLTRQLQSYFKLYEELQPIMCTPLSGTNTCSPDHNKVDDIKVLTKEFEFIDKENFFGSIFSAIVNYNNSALTNPITFKNRDNINNFVNFLNNIFNEMSTLQIDGNKTFDFSYEQNLKKKFPMTKSETEYKEALNKSPDKLAQSLVNKLLPFKLRDNIIDSSDPIELNPSFNTILKSGKFKLDQYSTLLMIKLIRSSLNLNLIIIDYNDFKIFNCNELDEKTTYYIFLLKDKDNYYLIHYSNKYIYTKDEFSISDSALLGLSSPPLFLFLYIYKECHDLVNMLFKQLYDSFINPSIKNSREIPLLLSKIDDKVKLIKQNKLLPSTSFGSVGVNYNIQKHTYSYYITVTLDVYEGKPGSTTTCDVKYTNILSDITALTGWSLGNNLINPVNPVNPVNSNSNSYTNPYTNSNNFHIGGGESKPDWYDSLFKGKYAITKQPVLKLGDVTRKRIIISHKKRDNIRNIKKKLSRKFRNITHKRGL